MSKIVIALGGNALGNNVEEQKEAINQIVPSLIDLIESGHQLIISHGNGPQVGMINLAFTEYFAAEDSGNDMPFPECTAMSEGYIGYHLQNKLTNECTKRKNGLKACTVLTQVLVSEKDPAFINLQKPIGKFYTQEEAQIIAEEKGFTMKEDSGRGYRRVVASPLPLDILEKKAIKILFDSGEIVIACGGGGIPVIETTEGYEGVPAVIDKDFATECLAELVDADTLIVLTAVPVAYVNYGTENQKELRNISVFEMKKYQEEGQFSAGSMMPKVEAVVKFVESGKGKKGIITSFECLVDALKGEAGTIIESEGK